MPVVRLTHSAPVRKVWDVIYFTKVTIHAYMQCALTVGATIPNLQTNTSRVLQMWNMFYIFFRMILK